ncbi:MAG: hypothetical protein DDT35_01550 [Firmicutes bacterium]|nr:hypothetical protein [Bacillota bacterium]
MKNIKYLMGMTKKFLDGKLDGTTYTLDFPYELELRYREMLKENREYAELIYEQLIERGTNIQHDENLSDNAFRAIIMTRYKYIKSVEQDGFC